MLRAWTHRNNVDIHHRLPRAWLATTAHRLAVDARRARRACPQEAELADDLPLADGLQGTLASTKWAFASAPHSPLCPVPSARYCSRSLPRPVGGRNGASCRSRPAQ